MNSFIRDKSVEAGKIFAALAVFGVIGKWGLIPKDYWGGELVKILVDAATSCTAVMLFSELVLGAPTVRLEWRLSSNDRELSGEVPIRASKQILNLQLKVVGNTLLQRYLLSQSRRGRFKIEVTLHPAGLVTMNNQGSSQGFRCGSDRLIFDGVRLESDVTTCYANFSLRRQAALQVTHELDVKVQAHWEPKLWKLPFKIARVSSGIERFVLEGRQWES
ncbi:hypothetical protein [Mycobacterium sp. SM3041]|uniref:hypothetical protein n=1 Tax=Mycobacterium sp. SM3041 TaxID=3114291 RepID=UPI0032046BDC